jgi:hypothetical protein
MQKLFRLMAIVVLAAGTATLLSVPSASAQTSGASLEETLNWLKDFLPSATGARSKDFRTTTSLEVVNGCQVRLMTTHETFDAGKTIGYQRYTQQFSFSEIDPSAIRVVAQAYDPAVVSVGMQTRSNSKTVIRSDDGVESHTDRAFAASFTDRASSERVANAFRHAAEICGKAEPF